MTWRALALTLPCLLLLGGSTRSIHDTETLFLTVSSDISTPFTPPTYVSVCSSGTGSNGTPGTDSGAVCYPDTTADVQVESWGVIVTEILDAGTEDCLIELYIDDTGTSATGVAVTGAAILVGALQDNTTGTCGILDDGGEGCSTTILKDANSTVSAGGWIAARLSDPDAAGTECTGGTTSCVCTTLQGAQIWVKATRK